MKRQLPLSILLLTFLSGEFSIASTPEEWSPFGRLTYATSSFAESRGSRYHAGIDLGTEKEQGWPIVAPEDGWVSQIRISPFFYGKNLFYTTKSGKTWLFAHLSGFPSTLSSTLLSEMKQRETTQCSITLKHHFLKGETIAFAGKTGIGNPHLHLELRRGNRLFSPAASGLSMLDTIAPQLLEIAHFLPDGSIEMISVHSPDSVSPAIRVTEESRLALKLVDYSREPKKNPMSIASLSLRCQDGEALYQKSYRELEYGKMGDVTQDHLWSRENEETPGDWHWIGEWYAPALPIAEGDGDLSRCLEKGDSAEVQIALSDHRQNRALYTFPLIKRKTQQSSSSKESVASISISRAENQDREIFTFLRQPMVASPVLHQLQPPSPERFEISAAAAFPLATVVAGRDSINWISASGEQRNLHLFSLSKKGQEVRIALEGATITFESSPLYRDQLLTAEWREDSTGSFFEMHPKGLPLKQGSTVEICAEVPSAQGWGIFWRSEGRREWNAFSKTERDSLTGKLCTRVDEIRDFAVRQDTIAPELGSILLDTLYIDGQKELSISLSVDEKGGAGFSSGRNFSARQGGEWIYSEYNMTDRRLRIPLSKLRDLQPVAVSVHDDFGNTTQLEIDVAALLENSSK